MKTLQLIIFLAVSLSLVGCTSTSSSTSTTQTYTAAEVSQHNSSSDCWLLVDGVVYDVTDFINSHPGGNEILNGCGRDATDYFNGMGGNGMMQMHRHSSAAEQILGEYKVGVEG